MGRITVFFVLSLWGLAGFVSAESNSYFNEKHKINLKIPTEWAVTEDSSAILVLNHEDRVSSFNISLYYFSEPVTVNGFQLKRMTSEFDGWMNKGERFGNEYEIARANVDDAFIAVYAKRLLGEDLSIHEKVVAEYYYLKNNYGFILSIRTPSHAWKNVAGSLRSLVDSFWIGTGTRPEVIMPERLNPEWQMIGKNPQNQFSIESDIDFEATKNILWDFIPEFKSHFDEKMIMPLISEGTLFFGYNKTIYAMDLKTGALKWSAETIGHIQKSLALSDGRLHFFADDGIMWSCCIDSKSGKFLYKVPLSQSEISHPIVTNQQLLFYEGELLSAYDASTGDLSWSVHQEVSEEMYPVASANYVLSAHRISVLTCYDSISGRIFWERHVKGKILYPPAIHNGIVLIPSFGDAPIITAFDLHTGSILWQANQALNGFKLISPISVASNTLFFTAQFQHEGDMEYQQKIVAMDSNTGEFIWEYKIDTKSPDYSRPPIIANNVVVAMSIRDAPLFSGDRIDVIGYNYVTGQTKQAITMTLLKKNSSRKYGFVFYNQYIVIQTLDERMRFYVIK